MRDHPGYDALNRDSATAILELPSPTIQPRLRVRRRLLTHSSGSVLLHGWLPHHPPIAILLAFLPASDHSPASTYENHIKTSNMTTSEVAMSAELN